MTRDGDVVGLEGDRRSGQLFETRAQPAEQITLDLDDLDAFQRSCRLDVAAVGREDDAVPGGDEGWVRALEAREVPDVDRPGDEEAPRAKTVELGSQARDAIAQPCSFR